MCSALVLAHGVNEMQIPIVNQLINRTAFKGDGY